MEERERKDSNAKFDASVFNSFLSPVHSSDGEEKTLLSKIRRIPSLVRKISNVSTSNGHANTEEKEEAVRLNCCTEVTDEIKSDGDSKHPNTPVEPPTSVVEYCSGANSAKLQKEISGSETIL